MRFVIKEEIHVSLLLHYISITGENPGMERYGSVMRERGRKVRTSRSHYTTHLYAYMFGAFLLVRRIV